MASPKRQVIDTSTTNPADFLAGNAPSAPPTTPAPVPTPAPAPANPQAEPPGTIQSVNTLPEPPATQEPASPNRPGLEERAAAPLPPDPFVLLQAFQTGSSYRNLCALPVPGGCLIRETAVRGSNFTDSICFVPGVKVENGQLAPL